MRSLEELKQLSKLALDHEELVAIARTASSNTDAKDRALVFTRGHGLDEWIAMSCRWLKILRDRISPEEFEDFVHKTKREVREMTSQTTSQSKTEDYMLRINELCLCPGKKIASLAEAARQVGFDPSRAEEVLNVTFDTKGLSEFFCAHCVRTHTFYLEIRSEESLHKVGRILLDPMRENGFIFNLNIEICGVAFSANKDFLVDSIEYDDKLRKVIFHAHTRSYYSEDGDIYERYKITLQNFYIGRSDLLWLRIEGVNSYPSLIADRLELSFTPFVPAS
ncbi:MAG: hypothetical protein HYS15_01060 [Candidatus Spechtbacteria bacterium]|nr:hypothetical protein [Candidatus Spechtbacteria bacterium]